MSKWCHFFQLEYKGLVLYLGCSALMGQRWGWGEKGLLTFWVGELTTLLGSDVSVLFSLTFQTELSHEVSTIEKAFQTHIHPAVVNVSLCPLHDMTGITAQCLTLRSLELGDPIQCPTPRKVEWGSHCQPWSYAMYTQAVMVQVKKQEFFQEQDSFTVGMFVSQIWGLTVLWVTLRFVSQTGEGDSNY